MSRAAGGTYSLPSGNPVVTGTVISSTWANNTLSDIGTALTDSLSRSGLGGMTAPLQAADGTVALPGLTFGTEPSTGLYRISAGLIGMSVLNRLGMSWAATGNVTIAAPTSGVPLTANGGAVTPEVIKADSTLSTYYSWYRSGARKAYIQSDPTGFFLVQEEAQPLVLFTNSTSRVSIPSTGGLSITAPSSGNPLTINGAAATGTTHVSIQGTTTGFSLVQATNTGGNYYIGIESSGGGTLITGTAAYATLFGPTTATELDLITNGVIRIKISSAGQTTIFEPLNSINALKNAATFETGSFTGTLTGCTTSPTATVNWTRTGNTITFEIRTGLQGTSNTGAMTVTGAPAAMNNAVASVGLGQIINNGVAEMGTCSVSGGVITFGRLGGAAFTAALTKGITSGCFTYQLS